MALRTSISPPPSDGRRRALTDSPGMARFREQDKLNYVKFNDNFLNLI